MSDAASIALIVNPISGPPRRGAEWRARVLSLSVDRLRASGFTPRVMVTARAGHAEELARVAAADGIDRIVAWGGDGTVNEVARGLVGSPSVLGIVPVGSGNGLARAVNIPRNPVEAVMVAATGRASQLDAGRIDGRWFFNVAGIGFDARVAQVFNARGRTSRGLASYVRVTIAELWRDQGMRCRVSVDGRDHALHGLMVAVANSREYGNGARIAPGARVDDGWLDVVAVGARSPLANLWRARRLFDGSIARDRDVWIARGRHVEVAYDGPMLYHVDGDAHEGYDRLVIDIVPEALALARPDGASTPSGRA